MKIGRFSKLRQNSIELGLRLVDRQCFCDVDLAGQQARLCKRRASFYPFRVDTECVVDVAVARRSADEHPAAEDRKDRAPDTALLYPISEHRPAGDRRCGAFNSIHVLGRIGKKCRQ
jgi:hypothetical protein